MYDHYEEDAYLRDREYLIDLIPDEPDFWICVERLALPSEALMALKACRTQEAFYVALEAAREVLAGVPGANQQIDRLLHRFIDRM